MTMTEARDMLIELCDKSRDPDHVDLRIMVKAPSMGPIAAAGISSMQMGIDWNKGMLILRPEHDLAWWSRASCKAVLASMGEGSVAEIDRHIGMDEHGNPVAYVKGNIDEIKNSMSDAGVECTIKPRRSSKTTRT